MNYHAIEPGDFDWPCGTHLYPGHDRLVWVGPYHDAAALDIASQTHLASMTRRYLFMLAELNVTIDEAAKDEANYRLHHEDWTEMAHSIHTFTSDGLRAVMRMAERLQWDPIDKIERLEVMALIVQLCLSHEQYSDEIRNGDTPAIVPADVPENPLNPGPQPADS